MKNICDIRSMQGMSLMFNKEECIINTGLITGKNELTELPHYVTVNDFLSRLNPDELSDIRSKIINALIRKRTFEKARFLDKYWLIIVDATQLYTFKEQNDDQCLTRTFTNKETGEKTTQYYHSVYHSVLEAKIVLGEDLVVSIASEFIENEGFNIQKNHRYEKSLHRKSIFTAIAKIIGKDPSTVSKEVGKYSKFKERKNADFAPIPCSKYKRCNFKYLCDDGWELSVLDAL